MAFDPENINPAFAMSPKDLRSFVGELLWNIEDRGAASFDAGGSIHDNPFPMHGWTVDPTLHDAWVRGFLRRERELLHSKWEQDAYRRGYEAGRAVRVG